jgi:tRNA-dihydrouridine synthase B
LRVARKHIGWYTQSLPGGEEFRREMNRIEDAAAQVGAVSSYFARLAGTGERLRYAETAEGATDFRENLAA